MSSPPSPSTAASERDVLETGEGGPQRPEQAHISTHVHSQLHKKHESIETELSEAMQSSPMPITTSSAGSINANGTSTPAERTDNLCLYGTANTLARPDNFALAPERRR